MYSYPETSGSAVAVAVLMSIEEAHELYRFASEISMDSGAGRDLADELALWIFPKISDCAPRENFS